ncbi:MAG TPA: helix-turn-helix transcriptional regulator [Polyangiaceae bacterium]|nr:helix-turn-helix transcriptional regulator [Polyangiaceae bacterium]
MRQVVITTPQQVGEILRGRRKARRISQQQVAAGLGISQGRLSTLEADPAAMPLHRLIVVANMLGLELVLQEKPDTPTSSSEW